MSLGGLEYVALFAALAGTAVSAYGIIQQGKAAEAQGEFEQQVADRNARIASLNAAAELEAAGQEAERMRRNRTRLIGSQVAAAAKSGLQISGSVLDVISDTALQSERDVALVLNRGRSRASGFVSQGQDFTAQGQLSALAGSNARTASYAQAGGTVLSGVGNTGLTYASIR